MVVDWTGGTCEMKYVIDFSDVEGIADIQFYKFKAGIRAQVLKICPAAGKKIVDDNDVPTFTKKRIAQVRSKESGTPSDQGTPTTHALLPFLRTAAETPSG